MKKIPTKAHCAVDYAFQRIGGKYKGRILWVLREDRKRYGELKRAIVGVTHKMLAQALKELEADGLVARQVYFEVPPRVEYSLSESGRELIPFIQLLREWAVQQMEKNEDLVI
ncbi:MAG: winged helix-turn-helix transcriptional regulator, partial [Bacteroidota bacterium]